MSVIPTDVAVDIVLSNLAIELKNLDFVAERIFPIIPVDKENGKYWEFTERSELRDHDVERAAGAEANEYEFKGAEASFNAVEYAQKGLVLDRSLHDADSAIKLNMRTVKKLLAIINLEQERRIKNIVFNTNSITNFATPTIKWDQGTATIESDIDTAKDTIRQNCGREPNSIVLPYKVKNAIKKDTVVRNLIRYTVGKQQGEDLLRSGELPPVLWNLETIIAGAVRNTANEGQSASISDVWPDSALVFYKENSPSLDALSLGYIMRVKQGGKLTTLVSKWRENARKGVMHEVSQIQDEKLTSGVCGYLLTDTLA